MYVYDEAFFRSFGAGSARSAAHVLPLLQSSTSIGSVVDFGCGSGAWLAVWRQLGVDDVLGIDGGYVPTSSLMIPRKSFVIADLTAPVRLSRRFDIVQSLEVAEHLPARAAATFVETLVEHAPLVLFSAAPPGQGGEHHVNEQSYEYWRALFRSHDYCAVDFLRPRLRTNRLIEPWYRYNILLFAASPALNDLPGAITAHRVPDDVPIADYAPLSARFARRLVRLLPHQLVTGGAIAVKHWSTRRERRHSTGLKQT